jgi:hypothetical protein
MVAPLFVDRRAVGTPSNLQLLLLLLLPPQPWFATLMETGTTDQRRVPLLCQKKTIDFDGGMYEHIVVPRHHVHDRIV